MENDNLDGPEAEFTQFVANLLRAEDSQTLAERGTDAGISLIAEHGDGRVLLVQAKAETPSTATRLMATVAQLRESGERLRPTSPAKLVLAVPGVLSNDYKRLVREAGVELWDGPTLGRRLVRAGVPLPVGVPLARGVLLKKPRAMELGKRLRRLQRGHARWSAYEQLCGETLDFLFRPPLEAPLVQTSDDVGVNRRDLILPNYAIEGFWAFMRTHYQADFIVVDAKNLAGLVDKAAVLQLANYLAAYGAGLFGMIVTREGADAGAVWTIREQWIIHRKLLVVLSDNDVRQMLAMKDAGDDPSITIRQKIEDFRLGL